MDAKLHFVGTEFYILILSPTIGITKWIKGWKRNGWVLSTGQPVINREDFEQLDQAINSINVKWVRIKSAIPGQFWTVIIVISLATSFFTQFL